MGIAIDLKPNEYIVCEKRHIFSLRKQPKDWISCSKKGWYYYYTVIKIK